jgi:luciferase-type oxidoreductase
MLTVAQAPYTDHAGWRRVFVPGAMTLGVYFPIEGYWKDQPTMRDQERLARRAEETGYAALWFRDVPLRDPSFGDLGQVYDPWVYLAWIAAHTRTIALCTGAIVLPLRHPLHVAKAAASVDQLSAGRLLLGVGLGDRAVEVPAFGRDPLRRSEDMREAVMLIRRSLGESSPTIHSGWGRLQGADVVPKPTTRELPLLVAGRSGQSLEWIAGNAHGWMTWPQPLHELRATAAAWRVAAASRAPGEPRPLAIWLNVDLVAEPAFAPWPLPLGWRIGRDALRHHLLELRGVGVAHVALNFKPSRRPADEILHEIGEHVMPDLSR